MSDEPLFGRVKYATIRRDFQALRTAIRSHDNFAAEAAWEKCERWLEAVPMSLPGEKSAIAAKPNINALIEVAEWFEQQRSDALARSSMQVGEDAEVLALCEKYGFGAVMDSASRLWARKDNSGAFFIGGCIGDLSAARALASYKPANEDI